jgi:serine/threonine protein phosphatase 1
MTGRTFAIGDVHGELAKLEALLGTLPALGPEDTIVFIGDYLDRGPDSAGVVELVRNGLPRATEAKIVALKGSHEDAWLKVLHDKGYMEFTLPVGNGCLATLRSYTGGPAPKEDESASTREEMEAMFFGAFFPKEVVAWLETLPAWYEDEHAIYVHAGLPKRDGRWCHPSEVADPHPLMWQRTEDFFRSYEGKRVVFGHTKAEYLPQELSCFTPHDGQDLFFRPNLVGVDTGCGHEGGFLTAIELPSLKVYESRRAHLKA